MLNEKFIGPKIYLTFEYENGVKSQVIEKSGVKSLLLNNKFIVQLIGKDSLRIYYKRGSSKYVRVINSGVEVRLENLKEQDNDGNRFYPEKTYRKTYER